ncbi:hypothetical protein [Actinophytocola sp.]|uniref:hypothetical protein n=1 Tax=Actinophytocola sp. TaxID=1872138 RepID=UPI002ED16621
MSMPDEHPPATRSDEDRSAFFNELMREERRRNDGPMSELAAFALVFGLITAAVGMFSGLAGSIFALATLVAAVGGVVQIRSHDRRGVPFVIVGVAFAAAWVVWVTIALG